MNTSEQYITELIAQALIQLEQAGKLKRPAHHQIQLQPGRHSEHGDWASNVALSLARHNGLAASEIATLVVNALPEAPGLDKVEIAGPGFLNFFLGAHSRNEVIMQVLEEGAAYGSSKDHAGERALVEFVSANPTGPLHVGHGRGAALGACLSRLLRAQGYEVEQEYYLNDSGRQVSILALSLWLRYLQCHGDPVPFPDQAYKGDYLQSLAQQLQTRHGESLKRDWKPVSNARPEPNPDAELDRQVAACRELLGEVAYRQLLDFAVDGIRADMEEDLGAFGVHFDRWFSERSLGAKVEATIAELRSRKVTEQRAGALWFVATRFGDDKDRVLVRENGEATYFAADIAYHADKFRRGYQRLINVWGADHHGYVKRLEAALKALGLESQRLQMVLLQFVHLYRGDQPFAMSTRSGSFVTLRELRDEVGNDAARFFYLMRRADQTCDFDLELAKAHDKDNPVYYVQYAHARICSMFRKLREQGLERPPMPTLETLEQLHLDHEQQIITLIGRYRQSITRAARDYSPHVIVQYLCELAAQFHAYYNHQRVLVTDPQLRNARLALSEAARQVLANGMELLGVQAPERM